MTKKKICVIFGGCSSEYDVSLQSAYSVIKNLKDDRYEKTLIGITQDGRWFLYEGDIERIPSDTWNDGSCRRAVLSPSRDKKGIIVFGNDSKEVSEFIPVDFVFPVLHGINGEDGTVQGMIELAGIPIVGCGMEASIICMDKNLAHILAERAGIKVPKSVTAHKKDAPKDYIDKAKAIGYPQFVKPVKAGSSFGISKVHCEEELIPAIEEAFRFDDHIIFEENISGFEVGCAVFGKKNIKVSPVDEIELFVDWFDYEEKYTQFKSKIHMPARISEDMSEKVRAAARHLYRALGCDSFARVDIFINEENELVFNEINTIPGMTDHSRFPSMVRAMGIEYSDLLDILVDLAEGKEA